MAWHRLTSREPCPRRQQKGREQSMELNLSEGQRLTILKYAELPAPLSERLTGKGSPAKAMPLTLDELDELLDHVEESVYRAKGNEKQKVLRIVEKVSKLLGSTIDPDERRAGVETLRGTTPHDPKIRPVAGSSVRATGCEADRG